MSRVLDPAILKVMACAVEQKLRSFTTTCHDENIRSSPDLKRINAAVQDLRAYIEGDMELLWRRERERSQALEEEVRRLRGAALCCGPSPAIDRAAALRALLAANRATPPIEPETHVSPLAAACAAMLRAQPAGAGAAAGSPSPAEDGDEDLYS